MVVLNQHHGGLAGEEHLPEVRRNHLHGNLDAHQIAEPHGAGHAGDVLDVLNQLVGIARGHPLHDKHAGSRHLEGLLQKLLPLGGGQILGQIGQDVVVDAGGGVADERGNQHQHGNQGHQLGLSGQFMGNFSIMALASRQWKIPVMAFQKSRNIWAIRPQKVVSVWAASASAGPSGSSTLIS